MDESLARGHARAALRTAESRSIAAAVVRVAGHTVPFNEKGQRRWSRRIIAASEPALIGKPIAKFGKRFELALPIFETRFDTLFEPGWRGLALGQVGFTPGPLQETAYEEMVLILDSHALTRIGQRADVVGLDDVLACTAPGS